MSSTLRWFKSSYSDSSGGACIEVAYDWQKSSYSSPNGGDCVEVAGCPHAMHVRDSKNPGPTLTLAGKAWADFAGWAVSGPLLLGQ
ncbi:DUF397 domain-containing protein [Streptomyces sp. ISL-94]|uniref:DUF397 domain-containing protein n=1 Tax=Streptomyces sp. ISL-94 TaxID=2819190 RepID=UPI001BE7AB94|nr:DUF397 domain-containing protein [Streptomyces sp. ISL-94]MBT2478686.1 DUF397 domain-containing protein [Streptomyces sp. ISL-94]